MREYVKIAVAIIAGGLILAAGLYLSSLQKRAALAEMRGGTLERASGVVADGAAVDEQRVRVEVDVGAAATQFRRDLEEASRNDPATRSRGDAPVPDGVRDAYRARRLARERSGRIEGGD